MSNPSPEDALRLDWHARIATAWEAAHALALELYGEAEGPGYFTGQKGNGLMAALEALPIDSPPEAFTALCEAHVRGTAAPVPA